MTAEMSYEGSKDITENNCPKQPLTLIYEGSRGRRSPDAEFEAIVQQRKPDGFVRCAVQLAEHRSDAVNWRHERPQFSNRLSLYLGALLSIGRCISVLCPPYPSAS